MRGRNCPSSLRIGPRRLAPRSSRRTETSPPRCCSLALLRTAEHHRAVADEYRRLKILDAAFDHLSAATRIDPRDAAAYDARARIWRDWGVPELGLADSARAVYYAPRSAEAHNTRGTLLAAAGMRTEAAREFEAALRIDPGATFARTNLCLLVGC